jgi:N-acetylglucosamine kinase-like BadF-type ATPase
MDYVLGVDGGGTKTLARITDMEGKTVAESLAGSGNFKSVGKETAIKNIERVVTESISKIADLEGFSFNNACFGLSGLDSPKDKNTYLELIKGSRIPQFLKKEILICNDSKIGLLAGSDEKNAIMIICGTGSNCYGINEHGEEAKANGWDYILGDEGSGFSIGLKALKSVMRHYDGRGNSTLLSNNILEALGLEDIPELIEWTYQEPFGVDRFAALAKIVCKTAAEGDKRCQDILVEEAQEASLTVGTVVKKLELEKKKFDLVLVGSVFRCERYFKDIFEKMLKTRFTKICFKPLTEKPVKGAIKLALSNSDV